MSHEIAHPETETETRRHVVHPAVDVFENDDGLLLRADLPGVRQADVDIQLDNGLLSLVGRRPLGEREGGGVVEYRRRFQVPKEVDGEKVSAHINRGVLSITLPRADAAKPRTIPIGRG